MLFSVQLPSLELQDESKVLEAAQPTQLTETQSPPIVNHAVISGMDTAAVPGESRAKSEYAQLYGEKSSAVLALAPHPLKADVLAVGMAGGRIFVCDLTARLFLNTFYHDQEVTGLAWAPTATSLYAALHDGSYLGWDTTDNTQQAKPIIPYGPFPRLPSVLLNNQLIAIDLTADKFPEINAPYLFSMHAPITAPADYLSDVAVAVLKDLAEVTSKPLELRPVGGFLHTVSQREWPLWGGRMLPPSVRIIYPSLRIRDSPAIFPIHSLPKKMRYTCAARDGVLSRKFGLASEWNDLGKKAFSTSTQRNKRDKAPVDLGLAADEEAVRRDISEKRLLQTIAKKFGHKFSREQLGNDLGPDTAGPEGCVGGFSRCLKKELRRFHLENFLRQMTQFRPGNEYYAYGIPVLFLNEYLCPPMITCPQWPMKDPKTENLKRPDYTTVYHRDTLGIFSHLLVGESKRHPNSPGEVRLNRTECLKDLRFYSSLSLEENFSLHIDVQYGIGCVGEYCVIGKLCDVDGHLELPIGWRHLVSERSIILDMLDTMIQEVPDDMTD